jgi:hypothetical protein
VILSEIEESLPILLKARNVDFARHDRKVMLPYVEGRRGAWPLPAMRTSQLRLFTEEVASLERGVRHSLGLRHSPSSLRLQHFNKGFLRNVDAANAFHPFLSFFLLFQQFSFSRDIAAVTFRGHVLA